MAYIIALHAYRHAAMRRDDIESLYEPEFQTLEQAIDAFSRSLHMAKDYRYSQIMKCKDKLSLYRVIRNTPQASVVNENVQQCMADGYYRSVSAVHPNASK